MIQVKILSLKLNIPNLLAHCAIKLYFCRIMRYLITISLAAMLLSACSQSEEDKAKPLLAKIDSLYKSGNYRATLDSIVQLREHYPQAIEARKTALRLWQNASLKLAQADVASTDIKLQEMTEALKTETNLYRRNMMTVKRDSLQARYEAMCGVVRMIHLRQKQH